MPILRSYLSASRRVVARWSSIHALAETGGSTGERPCFAGLAFVFSPLAWFHGTVALTYAVEAFFSAMTGYLCWRIYDSSEILVIPAAVTVGLASGFRPSFLLFLGPLLMFSLLSRADPARRVRFIAAAAALTIAVSAWFVPMVLRSGGLSAYWSALLSLWRMVPARQTVFNSSLANSLRAAFPSQAYTSCASAVSRSSLSGTARKPSSIGEQRSSSWSGQVPGCCSLR